MYESYKNRCRSLIEQGLSYKELREYKNFSDLMNEKEFEEVLKEKHNRTSKRSRTKTKFKEILLLYNSSKSKNKNVVFGTITLNDKILNQKENTYIRKIHNWLKTHFIYTILNKDYGTKNTKREHYHFVGLTQEPLKQLKNGRGEPKKSKKGFYIYELKKRDFGAFMKTREAQFEPTLCKIDFKKADIEQTINYLLKLNNHSMKEKNRVRIIKNEVMKLMIKF